MIFSPELASFELRTAFKPVYRGRAKIDHYMQELAAGDAASEQ